MSTTTASVPDSPTIALGTAALIHQYHAEIARYAVQLAQQKLTGISCESFQAAVGCDICQSIWDRNEAPIHDDSCVVGRVFALTVEIARLRAVASERRIEYFPASAPLGEFRPGCTVTHEQAARSFQGATA
jgi:hypothetical protein